MGGGEMSDSPWLSTFRDNRKGRIFFERGAVGDGLLLHAYRPGISLPTEFCATAAVDSRTSRGAGFKLMSQGHWTHSGYAFSDHNLYLIIYCSPNGVCAGVSKLTTPSSDNTPVVSRQGITTNALKPQSVVRF